MAYTALILSSATLLLILISLLILGSIFRRSIGGLKLSISYIMVALIIFGIHQIGAIFGFEWGFYTGIFLLLIVVFILLAIINLERIINEEKSESYSPSTGKKNASVGRASKIIILR